MSERFTVSDNTLKLKMWRENGEYKKVLAVKYDFYRNFKQG